MSMSIKKEESDSAAKEEERSAKKEKAEAISHKFTLLDDGEEQSNP